MSELDPAAFETVIKYFGDHRSRIFREYLELLRIPSISAQPEHRDDVLACADWLASRMSDAGLRDVRVEPTGGHPIVVAWSPHVSGADTLLVYAHYDVQPPDPLDEWTSPPFEPAVVDDEIFGRGSSDDKANVHLHIAAAEAVIATQGVLPVNVVFVFEGEEEVSSPHFADWLRRQPWLPTVKGCVVSDTTFFGQKTPSLGSGVRGMLYMELAVRTGAGDLHSGGYGGAVPNAAEELVRLLGGLKSDRGVVSVEGFYDGVQRDEPFEARMIELPFDEEAWLHEGGLHPSAAVGEEGHSTLERLWLRPSLDINGVVSGYTGDGPKTVIPALATAKLSCRLVPAQDPVELFERFERHIQERSPSYADVTLRMVSGSRAATTRIDTPLFHTAARAIEAGFGVAPVVQREGGSIPPVSILAWELDVPLVLLGFSPPDDHAHAPNERMRRWNYDGGLRTLAAFWLMLADGSVQGG